MATTTPGIWYTADDFGDPEFTGAAASELYMLDCKKTPMGNLISILMPSSISQSFLNSPLNVLSLALPGTGATPFEDETIAEMIGEPGAILFTQEIGQRPSGAWIIQVLAPRLADATNPMLCVALWIGTAASESPHFYGHVSKDSNGDAISGATVTISRAAHSDIVLTTSATGFYSSTALDASASFDIVVSKTGYVSDSANTGVHPGGAINVALVAS